jgi:hypothetical protein
VTVQLRTNPRLPTRPFRKSRSHRLARPRGGWVTELDPVGGLIGRAPPSRPLVGSGAREDELNRQPASKSPASRLELLFDIEVFSIFMNAFRHRFCVNSFFRSPIDIRWPSSMRPHYDRRVAATPPLHDPKIILTSTTPWNVPSYIYSPRFMYYHGFDLATAPHGWFNSFQCLCHLSEPHAHCTSLHTRDLDAAGYDFPREFGIGL